MSNSKGLSSRQELLGLSGPSSSSTSAPIASDTPGRAVTWTRPPTTIPKPGDKPRPPKPITVLNPYKLTGKMDSNPVRGKIILADTNNFARRPAKRPRTSKESFLNGNSFPGPNPRQFEEILDPVQGEDVRFSTSMTSERSADELNLQEGLNDLDDVHIFDSSGFREMDLKSTRNSRILPSDGPSTERLRKRTKVQTNDSSIEIPDSDDIEEVDPPDHTEPNGQKRKRRLTPKRETSFKEVNVGQRRLQFEQHEEPQAGPSKLTKNVKHVDFPSKPSRIHNMRGKNPPTSNGILPPLQVGTASTSRRSDINNWLRKDSIATSSTRFVDSRNSEKSGILLENWIWGDVIFLDHPSPDLRYFIRICENTSRLELLKRCDESEKVFKCLTLDALRNYTLQSTSVSCAAHQFTAFVHLDPKSDDDVSITLKFSRQNCSQQDYRDFLMTIQPMVMKSWTLVGKNVDNCWDSALQAARATCAPSHHSPDPDVVEMVPPAITVAESVKSRARGKTRSSFSSPSEKPLKTYAPPTRRSSRQIEAAKPKEPPLNPDELILVYPFTGPGAVNVTNGDLSRLEPQQFLNDTLIELWLKLMMSDLRQSNPELAEQVHVFSSFFYKKLDPKKPDKGYESLKKWTTKIKLFEKKYIIIPINENVHWYLAVIYHPEHILRPPPPKDPPPSTRQSRRSTQYRSTTLVDTEEDVDGVDVEDKTEVAEKTLLPNDDEDDPIEDADDFEDRVSAQKRPKSPVAGNKDVDEEMASVTQRTHDCSIDNCEDDASDEHEVSKQLGQVEGGGPGSLYDDETVEDSEPEREATSPSSSPLTSNDIDEEKDQPADDHGDAMTVDDEVTREPSPAASSIDMDVDGNDSKENAAVNPSYASSNVDTEASGDLGNPGKQDSTGNTVPASSFYSSKRPQRKLQPFPMDVTREEADSSSSKSSSEKKEVEIEDESIVIDDTDIPIDLTENNVDDETTYIFTMDSLGSKHAQAWRLLGEYLKFEAQDKKQKDEVNPAKGKLVDVPTQPNYCDCGLYLLHFAETFLADPEGLAAAILQPKAKKAGAKQRTKLWKGEKVESMRERMATRIKEESARWKEFRAQKQKEEEEKKKEAGPQPAPQEESEDEIIVGDIKMASPPKRKPRLQTGRKSVASKPPRMLEVPDSKPAQPAQRLRG